MIQRIVFLPVHIGKNATILNKKTVNGRNSYGTDMISYPYQETFFGFGH
jgi:hypothetical protein